MALNHLVGQQSPYLLQHVENPVDWYPWGDEALLKAKEEQKPILLSIGYSTCHWCHVMAHESFEDQHIAKLINENYIAIKVDREERPDIDQIYMSATVAMTGQGGWPLTVFLTPDAKPFFGGTYFPPISKWGSPGFMDLLQNIAMAWKDRRHEILTSSQEITQALIERSQKNDKSIKVMDISIMDVAFQQISGQFDRINGGFSGAPKFPMGHQLSFLLRYYKRFNEPKALEMVEITLRAIANGGICDHIGGGFHRYSTDASWHVPHFEKMLYDQALLVKAYLECYQITGSLDYAQTARETLDYILREMQDPNGGFYCAQDADSLGDDASHKSEGAFYIWSQQQIEKLLSEEQQKVFYYIFGVEPSGNAKFDPHAEFVGKNILYKAHSFEEAAKVFNLDLDQIITIIDQSKLELFEQRELRSWPHLDDKVLTDWNGLMLGVFAFASSVLNESRYLKAAEAAADFILQHLLINNRLLHRWRKNEAAIDATLDDYAFLTNGLLDLYEASMNDRYFQQAKILAKDMIDLFEDKESGGFYLTAKDAPMLIFRPKDIYDGAIPSGNSVVSNLLSRLYFMDPKGKWNEPIDRLFHEFSLIVQKSPSAYTFLLSAFDFYNAPSMKISLEGNYNDQNFLKMKALIYKHFIPNKTLIFRSNNSFSKAYVCSGNVCHEGTEDIVKLEEQLLS